MKKLSILLVLLLLVGCSDAEPTSTDNQTVEVDNDKTQTKDKTKQNDESGFEFESNGVTIAINQEAKTVVEKLGDSLDYFEAPSCAFDGMDKIYTYNGFELHTYEVDGVDYVLSVIFLDDSVTTKEGVYLFSSLDDVLEVYGENYTENQGLYTYEKGDTTLSFLIENNEVVSIEYMAVVE
ncbi:MAG: hypothetical protein ACLFMO_07480 [Eubacteriales bacterium]